MKIKDTNTKHNFLNRALIASLSFLMFAIVVAVVSAALHKMQIQNNVYIFLFIHLVAIITAVASYRFLVVKMKDI